MTLVTWALTTTKYPVFQSMIFTEQSSGFWMANERQLSYISSICSLNCWNLIIRVEQTLTWSSDDLHPSLTSLECWSSHLKSFWASHLWKWRFGLLSHWFSDCVWWCLVRRPLMVWGPSGSKWEAEQLDSAKASCLPCCHHFSVLTVVVFFKPLLIHCGSL